MTPGDKKITLPPLKGKITIVGIGNTLRGDDGAGPYLIKLLENSLQAKEFALFDTGQVPENYTRKIIDTKPETIILVDALELGEKPGTVKIASAKEIKNESISTHSMSLNLLMTYLKEETKADVYLVGIQPQNVSFGQTSLSPAIAQTVKNLKQALEK